MAHICGAAHRDMAIGGDHIWPTTVGWIETSLYQRLSRIRCDHWLELSGGKCVHMSSLGGNQQHHLGSGQRRQLVSLQHKKS